MFNLINFLPMPFSFQFNILALNILLAYLQYSNATISIAGLVLHAPFGTWKSRLSQMNIVMVIIN
jgi:hypothetical protein